jgi:hypothetical protein
VNPGATLGATALWRAPVANFCGELPNRTPVIDSAAARLSPSTRWPHTSLVTAMLAWPRTSETTCSGVPWASVSEAPECRSSCGCQWPSPADSHSREKACEKLSGVNRRAGTRSGEPKKLEGRPAGNPQLSEAS